MKGSEIKLVKYMSGDDKRFVIPVYQRNYNWKIENCKQLYDDLIKIIKQNRKSHFFGSIVFVYDDDGLDEEYLIIDGQQRLTTISILFLAMYNLLDQGVVKTEDQNLAKRILETFLIDKWKPEDKKIKLKPIKDDSLAYGKLFDEKEYHLLHSNVTINYNYFYNRILQNEISIDELYSALCKLEIIHIKLNKDDNPQLIFESLNSTGLDLSEGDKIRNYVLMGLSSKQQEEFYAKYWNKIEKNTNYDVSLFVRDYLSLKMQSIPAMNKIYAVFKNFVEDKTIETEELLKDLLKYSEFYNQLLLGHTTNNELNGCIYRLNRLETTVTRPYFLEVLNLQKQGILSIKDVLSIFLIVESYIFRRNICDLPTGSLNKIFLLLHREIINLDGTTNDYLEKFKHNLLSKREKSRFPREDEFLQYLETKNIYHLNSKNKLYLFERFENFGTAEDKSVWEHFDNGDYSIEHIMPQHLTPAWVSDLGENYENIHETWLHRLANLTITAYNSKYSNNTFEEKKTMKNGFIDSGIRMNQIISHYDNWGLDELLSRNEHMKNKALEIWQLPTSTYVSIEKELESCTLDDDISLSGRQLSKFSFKGIEHPVDSWVEMYVKVVKMLHEEDKSILNSLAYINDPTVELSAHFNKTQVNIANSEQIDDNLYVWKGTSTNYKMSLLRKLFKMFNINFSELVFYLKDDSSYDEEIAGTRYEIRRKYWNYALKYIHNAHGNDGSFSNVTTSKQNWISGYLGYNGLTINCVANYNNARVELYILTNDKVKNKEIFDFFYSNRGQIEKQLGIELTWKRGEETKSSSICYVLDNISIDNENEWNRMATWHAEWSKKFYDVFIKFIDSI